MSKYFPFSLLRLLSNALGVLYWVDVTLKIPNVTVQFSGVTRNFFRGAGGFQQIQLRTENGDLGAVAPSQGFWRQL
jgi:hypothetical protein